MRIRDKILIENGHKTKAKVKWRDGCWAYPYLWKEKKSDAEYKEAWGDTRIPKENKKKNEQQEESQSLPQTRKRLGPKFG